MDIAQIIIKVQIMLGIQLVIIIIINHMVFHFGRLDL